MELRLALSIVRRRPALVLAPAVLALALSLAAALAAPPVYRASYTLLVTRSEDRRFDTEDALAYDLPAIVAGQPFAAELAAELAAAGRPLTPEQVRAALGAANTRRVVTLWAESGDPAEAEELAAAAVALLQRRGLALWGEPSATPERPLVNVVVLERPAAAVRANGPRALAAEVALRTLAGLIAGVGLAFAMHYLSGARRAPGA